MRVFAQCAAALVAFIFSVSAAPGRELAKADLPAERIGDKAPAEPGLPLPAGRRPATAVVQSKTAAPGPCSVVTAVLAMNDKGGSWEAANDVFLALLRDASGDEELTSCVLAVLQESGDEESVPVLLETARRGSPAIRQRAAETLLAMKGRGVARELKARLSRLDPAVQQELSATLAARTDLAALPPAEPRQETSPTSAGERKKSAPPLRFLRVKLSDRTFEAASVADVDQDGQKDIVSGGFWYPGPDFRDSFLLCEVQPSGEYFDDFSDYPMDVNGDTYSDIVTGGFFGGPLRWRENPKQRGPEWKEHPIAHVGSIETTRFWDVDGDGYPEVCPNAGGNIQVFRLKRNAAGKGTGEFTKHVVRTGGVGHGLGFGDINGDGRGDFVGPDGWYEAPAKPLSGEPEWTWHREFTLGSAGLPILVHDVNGDGRNDLIVGQGHDYGLFWLEQARNPEGGRDWKLHMIEPDRSQFHELALEDLDNDGEPELITGKRWRAHNGTDPGADEPVGLYYYKINGGRFDRVTLNYGPASRNSGTGIYLWVEDIDENGWKDIVAPGKEGLYVFFGQGSGRGEPAASRP